MEAQALEVLKYPIGPYIKPETVSTGQLESWIESIETLPGKLISITQDLSSEQLSWHYRPGGWMIKQVVHHCADSHINSWARFKLALTEDQPLIKPYNEVEWAKLPDSLDDDLTDSLTLLTGLHARWSRFLKDLSKEELKRTFIHPAGHEVFTIAQTMAMYAWHSDHHYAHIEQALKWKGNFDGYHPEKGTDS